MLSQEEMNMVDPRPRPDPWIEYRRTVPNRWLFPLYALEYMFEWCAYWLSQSGFIATVEYLGKLGV